MPDESDYQDEESAARKRQLKAANSNSTLLQTPLKKPKRSSSAFGLFFAPINSFFGMFRSENQEDNDPEVVEVRGSPVRVHRVFNDEEAFRSPSTVRTTSVTKKTHIVYLNDGDENEIDDDDDGRVAAGSDSTVKTEEIEEEELVVEKVVRKDVSPQPKKLIYLSEDQPSPSSQEVQDEEDDCEIVEKSMEKQEDEGNDCEIIEEKEGIEVLKEIKRKSEDRLSSARRIQNEIVYLNELQEDYDENQSDVLSIESTASPTPDDSASRAGTPSYWKSIQSPSGSRNIRDYWRRSAPGSSKKTPKRTPIRQFNQSPSVIGRLGQSGIKKASQMAESSLDRYKKALIQAGVVTEMNHAKLFNVPNGRPPKSNVAALIRKAKKAIHEIQSSREGTPTPEDFGSRSSLRYSESDSRHRAGSHSPSISSDASTTESKLNDIVSKLKSVDLVHISDRERFGIASSRDLKLSEELRIRGLSRTQTREETEESVRKRLELQGIVVKPKVVKTEFVALPSESDKLCDRAWNDRLPGGEAFVEDFSIKLARKDLITLASLNWLNDEVINFYLQLVVKRSEDDKRYPKYTDPIVLLDKTDRSSIARVGPECRICQITMIRKSIFSQFGSHFIPQVWAFNTFFYQNITTKGYASVKRWTKKIDIFSCDVVLVPVHLQLHWCMAVVDMKQKRVDYYDSLFGRNQLCLDSLKKYLMEESQDKKKVAFNFEGWTFNTLKDIPAQQNGSDCGVFSCQFGEFASRRTKPIFTQEHMQYYRKRMLYELCNKKLLSTI